ncbi:MAG: T9SS type A sorting domain-containing protein [Candidatus Eisenbacteria sp.]|nr:T9SS type A sorting domain-containing protein [Candidatus Eisenbacteria bacterium]
MKRTVLSALCVCAIATLGFSTIALAEKPPAREFVPSDGNNPLLHLSQPLVFKQGGDTVWLQVYTADDQCPCDPLQGGECTGGPDAMETFCFEKYNPATADSLYKWYGSPGTPYFSPAGGNGWWMADARRLGSPTGQDWWHLDQYQAFEGYSWWCGALTGDRCADWDNAPGAGDAWNQLLVLDPDLGAVTAGETVSLDCWVRYDTECDYDYAYILYSNDDGASWETIATLNACSGNVAASCGGDYWGFGDLGQGNPPGGNVSWVQFPVDVTHGGDPNGGDMSVTDPANFRVGFKFESDGAWSDKDGRGNTDGAFFVDFVEISHATHGVLEFEDMDDEFESAKWVIQAPPPVANHWWMPHDPDPPREPDEGADICEVDASWVWCGCPFVNNKWRIPPESNGFLYRLVGPTIYTGWGEPTVPKEYAGLVIQRDIFVCFGENFCDYYDTKVNVYNSAPSTGQPAGWCGWENIDGYITYGGCDFMNQDRNEEVSQWMGGSVDSVQYAWDVMDVGQTDDWCWTTQIPKPHRKVQIFVDNVSFGLFDASDTFFQARVIDVFQDTFDLETSAHNALCANSDMPKILARSESLQVDVHDMNGLTGGAAWTRLYFSTDKGNTWDYNDLVLAIPDENDPDLGGTYIGSIHPSEIDIAPYPNAIWFPGTEVWYYVQVQDDLSNPLCYWPSSADPSEDPPARPWQNNYFEFSILPGSGEDYEEPNRLLLVDDFGRNDYDYHPCMEESVVISTENFYESVLYDLGYCYDKYDVQGASTGLSNEPWDLVTYPDPGNPDSLVRRYDTLIWFTSRFDQYTVLDTMQCRIVDFVRKGGNLFICGNLLGVDMTDYGDYSDAARETCEFYGGLLGAKMDPPGVSSVGIKQPHYYAKGSGLVGGSVFSTADKFHFHLGCPISVPHDLTKINTSPPAWAPNPTPYIVYEEGYVAGDTVVAIYNEYVDGGKVVHMCFDLGAMVDSCAVSCAKADYKGRRDLLEDVLGNLFGMVPGCPHYQGVDDFIPSAHAYSLSQNYPNPFNPDTDIQYSIRQNGRVSLKVYNVRGQVVKTLVDRAMQSGQYTAHWDGTNENGQMVSSGIYFCKMKASDFAATKKMILLK